jgi:hypothetical protein
MPNCYDDRYTGAMQLSTMRAILILCNLSMPRAPGGGIDLRGGPGQAAAIPRSAIHNDLPVLGSA